MEVRDVVSVAPASESGLIPEKNDVASKAGTGGVAVRRLGRLTVMGRSSVLYADVQIGARCGLMVFTRWCEFWSLVLFAGVPSEGVWYSTYTQ